MKRIKRSHLWVYSIAVILCLFIAGEISYMIRAGAESLPVQGAAADFTATDVADGKQVALQNLQGKIVLMTWYYTHCTNECPLTMYRFEQMQNQLTRDRLFGGRVVLVAMTLDPARDTPSVILQYSRHFHANYRGWYFLRANVGKTDRILKSWGVEVKPSTNKEFIEHTTKTVLIDQSGNIRATFPTANLNPSAVVADIRNLVSRESWQA